MIQIGEGFVDCCCCCCCCCGCSYFDMTVNVNVNVTVNLTVHGWIDVRSFGDCVVHVVVEYHDRDRDHSDRDFALLQRVLLWTMNVMMWILTTTTTKMTVKIHQLH